MKRFIFIIALISIIPFDVFGQFKPFSQTSSGIPRIVEISLKEAVGIMRVEFQLEDLASHERFNLGDKDYFGFSEGLCIKSSKGWIIPYSTAYPWINDAKVKNYPGYGPVVSTASILSAQDTSWKEVIIDQIEDIKLPSQIQYAFVSDKLDIGEGLKIGSINNSSEGWIVWACRNGEGLILKAYSHFMASSDSSAFSLRHKVIPENAIGGCYVGITYPSIGTVSFELLGILSEDADSWVIYPLYDTNLVLSPVLSPERPNLVPAGKQKRTEEELRKIIESKNNKSDNNKKKKNKNKNK